MRKEIFCSFFSFFFFARQMVPENYWKKCIRNILCYCEQNENVSSKPLSTGGSMNKNPEPVWENEHGKSCAILAGQCGKVHRKLPCQNFTWPAVQPRDLLAATL